MENCDRFYSQRNSALTFPYLQDILSYGSILTFVEIAVDISDFAPPIPQSNERIRPLHGDKRPNSPNHYRNNRNKECGKHRLEGNVGFYSGKPSKFIRIAKKFCKIQI